MYFQDKKDVTTKNIFNTLEALLLDLYMQTVFLHSKTLQAFAIFHIESNFSTDCNHVYKGPQNMKSIFTSALQIDIHTTSPLINLVWLSLLEILSQ